MPKLPRSTHVKLQSLLAKGKLPKADSTAYDDLDTIFGDLAESLAGKWEKPRVSNTVSYIAALTDHWSTIPGDGLVTGVAVNQPRIVARLFKRIQRYFPTRIITMKSSGKRLAWYSAGVGAKHAANLERIEEGLFDSDKFGSELMLGCFQRVLFEPAKFFA